LWSGQFETPFADIFSVHDAISTKLVDELSIKLTEEERNRLRKPDTRNPNAYRAYLLGALYVGRLRRASMLKGIEFFEEAIALDPQYARAYASMAGAYSTFILAADSMPGSSAAAARAAATRAIALDPAMAAAHAVLALEKFVYEWDWKGAEAEYRRAVALEPSNPGVHLMYALLLSNIGRHTEAVRHADEALRLSPVDVMVNTQRGDFLRAAGNVEAAIAAQKHTLEIAPDFWIADIHLGKAYADKGMVSEAVEAYMDAYEHSGRTSEPLARAGHLLGTVGRKTEARKILSDLLATSKKSYVPACNIAMVYTGLGEKAEAVRWLRRACDDRDGNMAYMRVEPCWTALRDEPGFADVERCVNLPPL
jgi:tetratricopeptide (TPR) repeat protein